MGWWKSVASGIRALFRPGAFEREMDEELRAFLDASAAEKMRTGVSAEEAMQAARIQMGSPNTVKHHIRSARWESAIETLWRDLRFTLRTLARNPGFTTVAVLTLALGIGANTAIFSVVEAVLLAPLPYPQPDRLVSLAQSRPNLKQVGISYPDFRDWQRSARSFEQMAAVAWRGYDLTSPGTSEHLEGLEVSSGLFSTLRVKLVLGRELTPAEDAPQSAPAVIISNRLWKDRFASSPQALGKSVVLDGANYTVTGILPPGFRLWSNADVYTSIARGEPLLYNDRTIHAIAGIARLKPAVNIGQAEGELSALQENLDLLYPKADGNLGTDIVPLKQSIVGDVRGTLLLILGAVGIVLLIACANVANLLLARSAARTREFAIRAALGANRARLVRQLLTESVLLALAGGILGLFLEKFTIALVLERFPQTLPRSGSIGVNPSVLFFALGISLVVGILFGLAPALITSSIDVQTSLKQGERGSTRLHTRGQGALVIVQMALTLVLLVAAGLLLRTTRHLWNVNPGFNAQHVITFKVGLSPSLTKTASTTRLAYQQLLERIRQVPGVEAADFTNIVPLSEHDNGGPFWVGAQQSTSMQDAPHALYFETGPDYLQAMQIPLLRGRYFTAADNPGSEPVVVIDSVLARTWFPGKDPVGQSITVAHWRTARVIGVVGHVRHWGLDDPGTYNPSQIYISFYQISDEWIPAFARELSVAVRTPLDVANIMPVMKSVIYSADVNMPVYNVETLREIASESMSSQRFPLLLLGAFAALALLLASVGTYGVISYSVTQRTHEIGIRMALGAAKTDIFRIVLGQSLRLTLAGIALGGLAALILARVLTSFSHLLYGVRASDPATFIAVSAVLTSVAVLACWLPARRAMRTDPIVALRCE